MSDRSSDSSCEWILLDENDENTFLENPHSQSDLNYDCIHLAASECINSSLSCEELDGIDDLFNIDNINSCSPQFETSCVEDLQFEQLGTSNISEDEGNDLCNSDFSYKSEDADINISSISKSHSYRHKRNDHVNSILNMMLALVVSTAIGLGTGHFLGWSHKCYNSTNIYFNSGFILPPKVSDKDVEKQNVELYIDEPKEMMNTPPTSENSSFSINWKFGSDNESIIQHACPGDSCTNDIPDISELSLITSEGSDEEEPFKEFPYSYSTAIGSSDVSAIFTEFELNKISHANALKNKPQAHILNIEHKPTTLNKNFLSESSNDEYNANNNQIEMLKQFYSKSQEYTGNLTSQLYFDLNKVVQSLNAIAVTQLSNVGKASSKINDDMKLITKQFHDFQNHLKAKITDIDNFIKDTENKNYEKQNFKCLQKMVYSLVDSVDYVIKASIRTFSGDPKKINVFKFSKNIAKIIFNSEKKWGKIRKDGFEYMEKSKHQDSKEKIFYKSKQWKRKGQVERNSDKSGKKYKRYVMNS